MRMLKPGDVDEVQFQAKEARRRSAASPLGTWKTTTAAGGSAMPPGQSCGEADRAEPSDRSGRPPSRQNRRRNKN